MQANIIGHLIIAYIKTAIIARTTIPDIARIAPITIGRLMVADMVTTIIPPAMVTRITEDIALRIEAMRPIIVGTLPIAEGTKREAGFNEPLDR